MTLMVMTMTNPKTGKPPDYVIAGGYALSDLQSEVNRLMSLGYKPVGGPFEYCDTDVRSFHQAMILTRDRDA